MFIQGTLSRESNKKAIRPEGENWWEDERNGTIFKAKWKTFVWVRTEEATKIKYQELIFESLWSDDCGKEATIAVIERKAGLVGK